jgi:hypothetical protein
MFILLWHNKTHTHTNTNIFSHFMHNHKTRAFCFNTICCYMHKNSAILWTVCCRFKHFVTSEFVKLLHKLKSVIMTFKKELYHCPEKNFFKQNKFYNSADKILFIIHTLAHNNTQTGTWLHWYQYTHSTVKYLGTWSILTELCHDRVQHYNL